MRPRYLPQTEQRGVAITRYRKRSRFARAVRFLIGFFSWN